MFFHIWVCFNKPALTSLFKKILIKEIIKMNVIDKARELGKMIQEDERYAV